LPRFLSSDLLLEFASAFGDRAFNFPPRQKRLASCNNLLSDLQQLCAQAGPRHSLRSGFIMRIIFQRLGHFALGLQTSLRAALFAPRSNPESVPWTLDCFGAKRRLAMTD
jgi:hypothetical protein